MIRKYFLSIIILTTLFSSLSAQNNAIKTGIIGAFLGDYTLSYERAVADGQSINLKIGLWNPGASIVLSDNRITPDAYDLEKMKGGINTSLEYRFYNTNGPSLRGWYIAPYMRVLNLKAIFQDEIDNNIFDVDFGLSRMGLGAKIGHQWIINEMVCIEVFGGLGLDRYNLKRDYTIESGEFTDYESIVDDVNDWIDDWEYLQNKETHEVTTSNMLSKLPFLLPGFEFGLNVGFIF